MSASLVVPLISVGLFFAMLACLEAGYRIGYPLRSDASAHEGLGAIETAIFALLGLLLGFAFAGSMSRLDARRDLIVREANVIGTAYLRLDLMPAADQPELRRLFREYLATRLRAHEEADDRGEAERLLLQVSDLQRQIWKRVVGASQMATTTLIAVTVVPAINDMIDVTTARRVALRTELPTLILVLILMVAVLSAFMAGYAQAKRRRRSFLHMIVYAAAVATTVYVVLDLDHPRVGLIRLDSTEQILRDLHDSIR
jgi:hypothetical protein